MNVMVKGTGVGAERNRTAAGSINILYFKSIRLISTFLLESVGLYLRGEKHVTPGYYSVRAHAAASVRIAIVRVPTY